MNYLQRCTIMVLAFSSGCTLPQITRPLNLYDINNGNTIELYFNPTSQGHGTISSFTGSGEQFQGECIFSNEQGYPRPPVNSDLYRSSDSSKIGGPNGFAEVYGFSKDINAKPVGTGIVVGDGGTTIELVFYHCSSEVRNTDIQTADGVGRDNKGHYYRVFLSTQE